MKKPLFYLIFYGYASFLLGCSNPEQNKQIATYFYRDLNAKDTAAAKQLTAKNFKAKYVWQNNTLSFGDFIKQMSEVSIFESKFDVLRIEGDGNTVYVTYDISNQFNEYLSIPKHKFESKIKFEDYKIKKVEIDTLKGFQETTRQTGLRLGSFNNWLATHFPEVDVKDLYENQEQLLKYLRKYYSKNVSN